MAGTLLARTRDAETDLVERLVELMPLALPRESWLLPLGERSLAAAPSGPWLPWPWSTKLRYHVSFRGTSREPQGLWASHTAQRTEQARSTLFTLLFFSSPGLEPNPARLEASVHNSLDLKHFAAGEH